MVAGITDASVGPPAASWTAIDKSLPIWAFGRAEEDLSTIGPMTPATFSVSSLAGH